ncbi:MAG: PIN domain-containing protein [Calditrichaeota bacterium]|nr:MAG: PIN domain-containing protein [Calditrichota bacterium]
MRKVFLDTAGILALVNQRDALHQRAVRLSAELEVESAHFFLTDYILVEIGNALAKHKKLAVQTIDYLQNSDDVTIIKITNKIMAKALDIYKKYLDKDWGLTDVTSFVVMEQEKIEEAFTSDHHFKQFGFKILL